MLLFIPTASGLPLVISDSSSNEAYVPNNGGYVHNNGSPARDTMILKPYKKQMEDLPVVNAFVTTIRQASEQVAWMHGSSLVTEYDKPLDIGQMHHLTQKSDVNAVVFIQPVVLFAHSLRWIYILATIGVYAHGPQQATSIDGGRLLVDVTLDKTPPALSSQGMEAIAASVPDDQAEREARAEVWFANDAARLKYALAMGMIILRQDVNNYLNGRRTPD